MKQKKLLKNGSKHNFLPFAANPHFFKPVKNKRIPGVTFIGTPYGTRMNKNFISVEVKYFSKYI